MLSPDDQKVVDELCLARSVTDTLIRDADESTRNRVNRAFAFEAFLIMERAGMDIDVQCKLLDARNEHQMSALIMNESVAMRTPVRPPISKTIAGTKIDL